MNTPNLNLSNHFQGFSLQEILVALAVLGTLASIGIAAIADNVDRSRQSKLRSDVQTLNRAVVVYIASGGSLRDSQTIEEVLDKIKTRQSDTESLKYPGFTGSLIDKRLTGSPLTEEKAETNQARAVWDRDNQQFTIVTQGPGGVGEFWLDASLALVDYGTESRGNSTIDFDHRTPSWIWAYEERPPDQIPGPSQIPTYQPGDPETPRARRVEPPAYPGVIGSDARPSRSGGIAVAALNGRADSSGGGIAIATGGAEARSNGGIAVGTQIAGAAVNDGVAVITPMLYISIGREDGVQLSRDTANGYAGSGDSSVVTGDQAHADGASANGSVALAAAITGDATANGTALAAALSATGYTRADGDGVNSSKTLLEPDSSAKGKPVNTPETRCRQRLRMALTRSR